ncbi:MAG: threonine/serine dehydratase, partial [Candidatus Hodarchaeota archaeon]
IVVPRDVSKAKLEKIKSFNVDIVMEGGYDEVEGYARKLARTTGKTYISPYNDPSVIIGQGTLGLEVVEDLKDFDFIIVPVGGGGLISGIAAAVKKLLPKSQVIGVQTHGSSTMYQSWKAGKIVAVKETDTLAEAFLGGVEKGSITFDIVRVLLDDFVIVSETTVSNAIRILWREHEQVVEGAGATSISPILDSPERFNGKRVVAVVSGGNIEHSLFKSIIDKQP